MYFKVTAHLSVAAGAQLGLLLVEILFDQGAERMRRSFNLDALLRGRIAAQPYLGVELAGYLSRAADLHRRRLADYQPPRLATDLVLEDPRPGATLTNAQAKARDRIVKPDPVVLVLLELQTVSCLRRQLHDALLGHPGGSDRSGIPAHTLQLLD